VRRLWHESFLIGKKKKKGEGGKGKEGGKGGPEDAANLMDKGTKRGGIAVNTCKT